MKRIQIFRRRQACLCGHGRQTWRWLSAALLLALVGTVGRAQEVAIQSSGETGRLSYGTLNNGINQNYRTMVHVVQVVREFSR